jgi:hypothetical protein
MKKIMLFLLLTLFSCSSSVPRISTQQKGVDSEFTPYIDNYKYIIGEGKYTQEFKHLHMNFAKLEGSIVGRCWWLLNGDYEIEIDPDYWRWNSFAAKEFLVYHELEHCIRKRMHTNKKDEIDNIADFFEEIVYQLGLIDRYGYLKDGCPSSIMHSTTLSESCRWKHREYYLDELTNWKR